MRNIFMIVILMFIAGCKECSKYETKLVHHAAWTQFIMSGKVMIPIFHPAYDRYEQVCIAWKEDDKSSPDEDNGK